MTRTGTNTDVVLLRYRILLGQNTLLRLIVKLNTAAKVLFRSHTHHLTLFQSHVIKDVHFERSSQLLVLFLHEDRQTITPTLRIQASILQVIRVRVVFHQLGMSASGEATETAAPHRGIVICRSTDEGELIQALVLAVGTVCRRHLLHIGHGQLQFLPWVTLKDISSTRALAFRTTR